MNPRCHRCTKTVYPTEKLACLDKYWHKGCFNCETCKMTLSMKTYKGYNKLPYCNTHYPTTKFTAVADTPENLRLKKNTTNQSSVEYHKDFETNKAKFTVVSDDPETLRLKKNTQNSSDISYQGKRASVSTGYGRPDLDLPQQPEQTRDQYQPEPPRQPAYEPEPEPVFQPPPPQPAGGGKAPKYIAIYDYTAADDDEVTFVEGDIIVNGEEIDAGWMTGTVERTGEHGMLPSNYVEKM